MAQRAPALVTPFWVRIASETSLSPGWLLIAFPAVLYPAYLALEALFGRGVAGFFLCFPIEVFFMRDPKRSNHWAFPRTVESESSRIEV